MADRRIDQLTEAEDISDEDLFVIWKRNISQTRSIEFETIKDYINNLITQSKQPNWSNAVALTVSQLFLGYSCPSNGMLVGIIGPNGYNFNEEPTITINDIVVTMARSTSEEVASGSVQCSVNAGDIIKITNCTLSRVGVNIHFVPYNV